MLLHLKAYKNILKIFTLMLLLLSCSDTSQTIPNYTNSSDCGSISATYNSNVKTILDANCATSNCHNSIAAKSGIRLDNFGNAKNQFSTNNSNLCSINHSSGCSPMPRGAAKLSDEKIKLLTCWVKNGCPE